MAVAQRIPIVGSFEAVADREGWGDGLPLIPPTEERVSAFLAVTGARAEEVIAQLPPSGAPVTMEKIAANAVMTGAAAEALPLLRAALEAMAEPEFDLHGLNATTGSVVPAVIVNGPIRQRLEIRYSAGCLGGAGGGAPSIGRALRLVMRNVAGQRIDVTSQSVFGTPGRVAGIVFAEWEERSPWAPLAERRGLTGNAVTVHAASGTLNITDVIATTGRTLLEVIGKSVALPGAAGFLTTAPYSELVLAFNPLWAELIARDVPAPEDVQQLLWEHASLPIEWFPPEHRGPIEALERVDSSGRVHLLRKPDDVLFLTAGGLGGLHAAALHSWGPSRSQSRTIE